MLPLRSAALATQLTLSLCSFLSRFVTNLLKNRVGELSRHLSPKTAMRLTCRRQDAYGPISWHGVLGAPLLWHAQGKLLLSIALHLIEVSLQETENHPIRPRILPKRSLIHRLRRLSFHPCYHSPFSKLTRDLHSGLGFLFLFLAGKSGAWCLSSRPSLNTALSSRLFKLLLTTWPLFLATWIALTRLEDYVSTICSTCSTPHVFPFSVTHDDWTAPP